MQLENDTWAISGKPAAAIVDATADIQSYTTIYPIYHNSPKNAVQAVRITPGRCSPDELRAVRDAKNLLRLVLRMAKSRGVAPDLSLFRQMAMFRAMRIADLPDPVHDKPVNIVRRRTRVSGNGGR